jgi:hypothetical protein
MFNILLFGRWIKSINPSPQQIEGRLALSNNTWGFNNCSFYKITELPKWKSNNRYWIRMCGWRHFQCWINHGQSEKVTRLLDLSSSDNLSLNQTFCQSYKLQFNAIRQSTYCLQNNTWRFLNTEFNIYFDNNYNDVVTNIWWTEYTSL